MGVKKLMYVSLYDFKRFEDWLRSMAGKGLFLSKINNFWCVFDKDKPQDIEYRTRVGGKKLKELYSNNGWQHVCSFNRIQVFGAFKQDRPRDVNTTPEEYISMLNRARNRTLWNILSPVIILVLAVFVCFKMPILSDTPWLHLLELAYTMVFILVLYLSGLIICLRDLLAIRGARRDIMDAVGINKSTDNDDKSFKPLTILGTAIFLMSFLVGVFLCVLPIKKPDISKLTLENNTDIIRLNDIEELNSSLVDMGKYDYKNIVVRSNMIIYKTYDTDEEFLAAGEEWNNKEYSPSLEGTYYEIYSRHIAEGVARDLVHEAETRDGWFLQPEVTRAEYDGLDEAYYIEGGKATPYIVVARKGNRVIKIRYYGKRSYTDVLEAAEKKL